MVASEAAAGKLAGAQDKAGAAASRAGQVFNAVGIASVAGLGAAMVALLLAQRVCVRRFSFVPHSSQTNVDWLSGTACTCWQRLHLRFVDFSGAGSCFTGGSSDPQ
jgi:hypothetical protein